MAFSPGEIKSMIEAWNFFPAIQSKYSSISSPYKDHHQLEETCWFRMLLQISEKKRILLTIPPSTPPPPLQQRYQIPNA